MVNVIPPDHVDDIPVVEPNQHDDVLVIPEPVLVDEDEDPEEDEFEEEEEPQEEEDDIEVEIEEDKNEPELTYPYEEVDPLKPCSPASEWSMRTSSEEENVSNGQAGYKVLVNALKKPADVTIEAELKKQRGVDIAIVAEWARQANAGNDASGSGPARGVVELRRWFEKTESVFGISECVEGKKVKFAAATLQGPALTWWNAKVATMGLETNNQKEGNARAMTTALTEKKVSSRSLHVCECGFTRHDGPCTIKCHKCGKVGHKARHCKEKSVATGANAHPILTCYDCGKQGHTRNRCPKKVKQEEVGEVRGRAYAIKDAEPQGLNVVTAVNKSPTHYPYDLARTFRVMLYRIYNDKWKSFQSQHQTALRISFEALNVENLVSKEVETGNKASTSGLQDKGQSSTQLLEKINMFEKKLLEGQSVLVDDDGKPVKKVDYSGNQDSEDEIESRQTYVNDDYDPYDDDMYESQDILDNIQSICDNLDIKGRSSYAREMIELRADVELKDTIIVVMSKLVEYCLALDVMKNLKNPRQDARGLLPALVVKKKQVVVSNKDDLGTNEENSKSPRKGPYYGVSPSNHEVFKVACSSASITPIGERIDKVVRQIIEGKLTLVDDDGKLLPKVVSKKSADSDSEMEDVVDDHVVLMTSRSTSITLIVERIDKLERQITKLLPKVVSTESVDSDSEVEDVVDDHAVFMASTG
ncbi:putative reverse transcriptase domain-containing protein [Tanacetum coccineum]